MRKVAVICTFPRHIPACGNTACLKRMRITSDSPLWRLRIMYKGRMVAAKSGAFEAKDVTTSGRQTSSLLVLHYPRSRRNGDGTSIYKGLFLPPWSIFRRSTVVDLQRPSLADRHCTD